jgi:ABC-type Fe3+-hydroxamate transport system substrate-binding protein
MASDPAHGKFYIYNMRDAGNWATHYRDLGIQQARLPAHSPGNRDGISGYEMLLAIDPEVIIVRWALNYCDGPKQFRQRFVAPLRHHPLGAKLKAVQNGRVVPGGNGDQGPITHLFQLEMMAMQLFPARFGQWRWGVQPDQPLFDRTALGEILMSRP